jgi:hypothetical protein
MHVKKVTRANPGPRDTVDIRGADAVACRSERVFAALALGALIELNVVRQNQVSKIRNPNAGCVDSVKLKCIELSHQLAGGYDGAGTDDAMIDTGNNTAWDDPQLIGFIPDTHGVPSIRAAAVSRNDMRAARQEIDNASLAFIPPLGADDKGYGHRIVT